VRVTIVGGGLAGITAALECADAGAEVTVFEARPFLGGATFSIARDGLWLDNGQHVFLRCCTEYVRLLHRLGAESQVFLQTQLDIPVLAPDGRSGRLRRNNLPAPLHLAGSILRFPFLSVSDRLGVLRAARRLHALELADPELDSRTFGDWLAEQKQSPATVAALWNLIALPTLNLPADVASLALAAMVFKTALLERNDAADVGYAAVPLKRLHGDAAERALNQAGVELQLRTSIQTLDEVEADATILAVPHDEAARLVPELAATRGLGFSPIVNVHVVYDRPVTDLPLAAGLDTPIQFVFDRTGPAGLDRGQYLAVSVSGAAGYEARSSDDIRAIFLPALADLFPAARTARVERFFVTREPQATIRGVPGTARLRPGPVLRPGLYVAGAWTDTGWPATMEGAVRSGVAAARAALSGKRRRPREEVVA
jgi:squalene-associated FAD-dependent desaturase